MKLRNKKTGKIIDAFTLGAEKSVWEKQGKHFKLSTDDWCKNYNSLAELNEEWEDYELKEYWFVDSGGEVKETTYLTNNDKLNLASFGNYFETEEEAEKAVEKLKAWKRLKDKGFEFTGIYTENEISFEMDNNNLSFGEAEIAEADLALLFGGEE